MVREEIQDLGERGFTLVELIVVLLIMSLLTAAIVPIVTGYVGEAKTRVEASNIKMLEDAARLYATDLELRGIACASEITGQTLVEAGYVNAIEDAATYQIVFSGTGGRTTQISVSHKSEQEELPGEENRQLSQG